MLENKGWFFSPEQEKLARDSWKVHNTFKMQLGSMQMILSKSFNFHGKVGLLLA